MRKITALCLLGLALAGCAGDSDAVEKSAPRVQKDATVKLEMTMSIDGNEVMKHGRDDPFSYVHGVGQAPPGMERELAGLTAGDERKFQVAPQDGFGETDPSKTVLLPADQVPEGESPKIGEVIQGKKPDGTFFRATIREVTPEQVTLDLNHPYAGKTLDFAIRILEVSPPSSLSSAPPQQQ